jgi:hypothetical protein
MNELIERRFDNIKVFASAWSNYSRALIVRTYSEPIHEYLNGEYVEIENIENIQYTEEEQTEYLAREVGY